MLRGDLVEFTLFQESVHSVNEFGDSTCVPSLFVDFFSVSSVPVLTRVTERLKPRNPMTAGIKDQSQRLRHERRKSPLVWKH